MKLIKIVPTLAAVLTLAACANNTTETVAAAQPQVVETTKSVVYSCLNKKSVTAVYTFANQDAVNAVVKVGKKGKEISLKRDAANTEFASFVDGAYIWNVDPVLTLSTAEQAGGAMLTQKGEEVDTILAKLCQVNKKATAKLNP